LFARGIRLTIRGSKKDGYTVADNGFIKDDRLSWQAKGLMTYLLSLPDDWDINLVELERHAKDGIHATRAAVRELQTAGYIKTDKIKHKGRFAGVRYTVVECPPYDGFPHTEKPHAELSHTEKPHAENPRAENRTLLNTNILNTNILNTDNTNYLNTKEARAENPRFTPPSPQDVKEYAAEKGYSLDAERFCDFYTSKNWFVGKTKMKDWKAAVRNWVRRQDDWKPVKRVAEFDHPEEIGKILF
jgi:hypothetical protein